jgi:hypothetical protein
MKRLLIAIALTCILSVSAFAGDIPMTGAPSPGATQGPSIAARILLTVLSLVR